MTGQRVALPFFGLDPLPWARPGLDIGGSGNNFTTWLNKNPGLVIAVDNEGAGAGYTAGDVLTCTGGTFTQAGQVTVDTVDGDGLILTFHVSRAGSYTVVPNTSGVQVPFTGGSGTGATFGVVILTNIDATDNTQGKPLAIGPIDQVCVASNEHKACLRGLYKTIGAAPFIVTTGLAAPQFAPQANIEINTGLFLLDVSAQKAVMLSWYPGVFSGHHINLAANTLTEVFSYNSIFDYFFWLRFVHDGANLSYKVSSQNLSYLTIFEEAANAYLTTIDAVGFGTMVDSGSPTGAGGGQSLVDCWSWVES